MRNQRRLINPLLRRVQRHTRVATLFHASSVDTLLAETPRLPTHQASLATISPVPAPTPAIAAPLIDLAAPPGLPGAVPVQTSPQPEVPSGVRAAPVLPVQTRAVAPPVAAPVGETAASLPQAAPAKVDEEQDWKRLQTILRKHAEKDQAEQVQGQEQASPAAAEPPVATSLPERETPAVAASSDTPSMPVQRRSSVVQEFSAPPAARPTPVTPAEAGELPAAPPSPVPGSPQEQVAAGVPKTGQAVDSIVADQDKIEPVPSFPAAAPATPLPRLAAAPPVSQPEPGVPAEPAEQPVSSPTPPAQMETATTPAAQPAAPIQRQPVHPVTEAQTQPAEEPAPIADLTDAPTVQLPRPSLAGEPPSQPVARSSAPVQEAPSARFTTEEPTILAPEPAQPEMPAIQHPPQAHLAPPALPIVTSRPETPTAPAVQPAAESSDMQLPPAPVKASLSGPPPLQRKETQAPAPQPQEPAVAPAAQEGAPSPVTPPAKPTQGYLAPPSVPEVSGSAAPLEAIWPVQRMERAPEPSPAAPASAPVPAEVPVVLPHNEQLGQILGAVAPGLPSESSVELVTPRKPRPSVARKPTPVTPLKEPALDAMPEAVPPSAPAVQRQPVEPEQAAVRAAPTFQAETSAMPRQAAPSQPTVTPVPTEIGPLPSDLWSLIDQPTPEPPQPVEKPAPVRPSRQSALQRHVEEREAVQRAPLTSPLGPTPAAEPAVMPQPPVADSENSEEAPEPEVFMAEIQQPEALLTDVIQRTTEVDEATTEVEPAAGDVQPTGAAPNVEELAQRVYREIRRRLAVEFERWRRS